MKKERFMTIHILKPGNYKEPFDPSEYLKTIIEGKPSSSGFICYEGNEHIVSVFISSSWYEARYSEILLHYLRGVLWIFGRACLNLISRLYQSIVFSKIGR